MLITTQNHAKMGQINTKSSNKILAQNDLSDFGEAGIIIKVVKRPALDNKNEKTKKQLI